MTKRLVKRTEKQLVLAVFKAEMESKSEVYISNLRKTLARKRDEKKTGRILAAHKRWATIKANRAARQSAEAAL